MSNIIDAIAQRPRPGELADWWAREQPKFWAGPLTAEETDYLDFFSSSEAYDGTRMSKGVIDPNMFTAEQKQEAVNKFGNDQTAKLSFANWESRRRIISHYVFTHPITIELNMELYRLSRDVNPPHFVVERIYQLITGKEMFTGSPASKIRASVDLVIPVIIGRAFRTVTRAGAREVRAPRSALTDPIYDLPPSGGMMINGRWYTEHALERMAPDIITVRTQLTARATERTNKIGLKPGSDAYNKVLAYQLEKIDPRGIPPSIVEAEIMRPGSTNVKVITAKRGQVVITVIPRVKKR